MSAAPRDGVVYEVSAPPAVALLGRDALGGILCNGLQVWDFHFISLIFYRADGVDGPQEMEKK